MSALCPFSCHSRRYVRQPQYHLRTVTRGKTGIVPCSGGIEATVRRQIRASYGDFLTIRDPRIPPRRLCFDSCVAWMFTVALCLSSPLAALSEGKQGTKYADRSTAPCRTVPPYASELQRLNKIIPSAVTVVYFTVRGCWWHEILPRRRLPANPSAVLAVSSCNND